MAKLHITQAQKSAWTRYYAAVDAIIELGTRHRIDVTPDGTTIVLRQADFEAFKAAMEACVNEIVAAREALEATFEAA